MDPNDGHVRRDRLSINDHIPYLPIEDIGGVKTQSSSSRILVSIYQTDTCEVRCALYDRQAIWIADDLCVIIIDDRCRYTISPCWKIYNSGRCG